MYLNKYKEKKEKARKEAIEWQNEFLEHNYSYGELAYYQNYFESKGKRYGLIREFKGNSIL